MPYTLLFACIERIIVFFIFLYLENTCVESQVFPSFEFNHSRISNSFTSLSLLDRNNPSMESLFLYYYDDCLENILVKFNKSIWIAEGE